jgi:hypothetical protein
MKDYRGNCYRGGSTKTALQAILAEMSKIIEKTSEIIELFESKLRISK